MNASRFLFGEDFRGPRPADRASADPQALAAAHAQGVTEGEARAAMTVSSRLAETTERLGLEIAALMAALDARTDVIETDAVHFFRVLADRLAGPALAREPLAPIAQAAREAFRHLRGVPHLAFRVPPDLVEAVDTMAVRLGRENGYEGRVIVLGDDALAGSDLRVEWADGGVVRDAAAIDRAVDAVLETVALAAAGRHTHAFPHANEDTP